MTTWIALLRAINVGGKNKLPMADLRGLIEDLNGSNVRTYLQSGNAVFESRSKSAPALSKSIGQAIESHAGFRPPVLLRTAADLRKEAKANPFPDAEEAQSGKTLHLFFLDKKPDGLDAAGLDAACTRGEAWKLTGKAFYLHTPENFRESKIAAKAERLLGVPATARNWRTVSNLLQLAEEAK